MERVTSLFSVYYKFTSLFAERLSKFPACRVVHQVAAAVTRLRNEFIAFPGHLPTHVIKQSFYDIAGTADPTTLVILLS